MSERKRRKTTDARRLRGYADDLRGISSAISAQCAFPHQSRQSALPLRTTSATHSNSRQPQPQPQAASTRARRPPAEPPRSLFSVVSATVALAAGAGAGVPAPGARDSWRQALLAAAAELGADGDAQERCGRLLRRMDALTATVSVQQEQLKQLSSEIVVNERVEAQLEREEREWEEKMQVREQRVAELEVELKALQEVNDASFNAEFKERDDGDDGDDSRQDTADDGDDAEEDDDAEEEQEAAARNVELREALALRMEERRDIQAALASLQRKKQQRGFSADRAQAQSAPSDHERALLQELQELQDEKDALQRQIIASEEEQEENDEHSAELPRLKARVAEKKRGRADEQERLDAARHALTRLKNKMRHMVDVQILTAGDTIPSTLREEAVILHLLYAHEGEMGVNELKLETGAAMAAHGKPSSSGAVIRALYSLVANGVVQIDRSYGNGLVTSLLV